MAITKRIKPPISNSENKIDISEAEVIDDNTSSNSNQENSEQEEADKKYVENLNDQKTIDLNEVGKKDAGEKTTIDFMNEESIKDFTSSQTKKAEPNTEDTRKSQFDGKTIEDVQAQIKKEENDSSKKFTLKDMEEIAGFIIELIDTGFSSAFNWWAGDSSINNYALPKSKKDMLSYQLALILVKYQAKFKIEFMFLLSIIIMYAPAFMLAKKKKAEIKQGIINKQNNKTAQHSTYKEKFNKPEDFVEKSEDILKEEASNLGALRKRGKKKNG